MTDGISISDAAVGALCTLASGIVIAWIKAKWGSKTAITPIPLPVDLASKYVTCDQCAEHRRTLEKRIDAITPQLSAIARQIRRSEENAEKRAVDLHRRLDPIVEVTAATKFGLGQHLEDHRTSKQPSTLHR